MNKIRWGIIGAGGISSKFAEALNYMADTELAAIASRDLGRAEKFANRFSIIKAYGSYEELAKDPEIDVIYIGTPHPEHKENAALCIKNGKSVLCEKSFTLNQVDTQYLIDLAKEHNVFLMEAMWTKFLPVAKQVKQWILEKKIGNVRYINVAFGYQAEFDINSRLFNPELGGGALLDVGVYPVTYAIYLMGKLPDEIVSTAYLGKSAIDEMNVIIMKYKDEGVIANLSSAITVNCGTDAVIVGDKGKIVVPYFWAAQSAKLFDLNGNLLEACEIPFDCNGYEYEAAEVNQCIKQGKLESDVVPLKDTLDIMKLMDGLRNTWQVVYPSEKNSN